MRGGKPKMIGAVIGKMTLSDFVSIAEQAAREQAVNARMRSYQQLADSQQEEREKAVLLTLGRPEYRNFKHARAKIARDVEYQTVLCELHGITVFTSEQERAALAVLEGYEYRRIVAAYLTAAGRYRERMKRWQARQEGKERKWAEAAEAYEREQEVAELTKDWPEW